MVGIGRLTGQVADPEAGGRAPDRETRVARWLLLGVVGAYLLVQLVLFSFDRAPRWDEAVYLSQVMPGTKAQFMSAFRARGLPLLIAPVTWWGGSVLAVRLFLAVVSAVAMTEAFWVWIPFIGFAAPLAALLFGFSWVGLFGSSEIYPNFVAAVLALAVAGHVFRWQADGGRRHVVAASALTAVLALVRPTEATAVFGAICVYVLLFKRPSWRVLAPLGLGLMLGWLPWLIEMSLRFGGPISAFDQAGTAHLSLTSVAANVRQYLAYTDGEIFGLETHVPLAGVLWWGWLIAIAIVACAQRRSSASHDAAALSTLGAAVLAAQYVVLLQDRPLAPRYLLPALALVSIAAAIGTVTLIRGGTLSRALGALALLLVVPWGVWQIGVADRVEAQEVRYREQFRVVGLALKGLAGGQPCTFISLHGTAMIDVASGCVGKQIEPPGPTPDQLRQLSSGGEAGFVILRRRARPESPLGSMKPALSTGSSRKRWFIYQLPPT